MIASPFMLRCQLVNSCVLLVATLLLSASAAPSVRAQHAPPLELKHFKKVKTIRFDDPDTLLIGTIDHMDVDPAGRILVVDESGRQVLLFDSTGALQASLDPTTCHPGFTFRPMTAHFGGDAFIFIQNGSPWGFRFTAKGDCLGSADEDYSAHRAFDIDPAGTLYGVYSDRPGRRRILRRMSPTGRTLGEFPIPPSKYPNATRRIGMLGPRFIADGEHLFLVSAPEQDILKLSLDGTPVGRISQRSSWFRSPPRQDLPDIARQIQNVVGKNVVGKWSQNATTISGLFELTDQTLMLQYNNKERGGGYQVFTKDGVLVAEELGIKPLFFFLLGANGLVYRVVHPSLDGQGDLPNPNLEVYRFVMP